MQKNVLVTRPIDQANSFATELEQAGFTPVIYPLLSITPCPVDFSRLDKPDALIITSLQVFVLRKFPETWLDIPVFCVGEKTAVKARETGFKTVHKAPAERSENIPALLEQIIAEGTKILYLRGDVITTDFAPLLKKKYHYQEIIAYRADEMDSVDDRFCASFPQLDDITVFSARTGRILAKIIRENNLEKYTSGINLLCLSPVVVDSLSGLEWKGVYTPEKATAQSMIHLLKNINK